MEKQGKILVISADHLGDSLLGGSFDRESKILTVRHLRQNLNSRADINAAAVEILMAMTANWGELGEVIFRVIENEELTGYLGKNCTARPASIAIKPADIPQLLYRTNCALQEGRLLFGDRINTDFVEVALSEETYTDRIVGHFARVLVTACDIAIAPALTIEIRSSGSSRMSDSDSLEGFCFDR